MDYDKAIELEPDRSDYYFYRGYTYYEKEVYNKAIDDFTKTIELSSDFYPAYKFRALSYRKTGKDDLAKKDEKMIESLPKQKTKRSLWEKIKLLVYGNK